MNCAQARAALSAHLDNELAASEAAAVEAHRVACAACSAEFEALRRASRLVRDLPLRTLPAGFLGRLRARQDADPAAPAAWVGPRPLAFAAAIILVGLVVAGPWRRHERLAHAPGGPVIIGAASQSAEAPMPATAAKRAPAGYSNEQLQSFLPQEGTATNMVVQPNDAAEQQQPQPFLGDGLDQAERRTHAEAAIRQLSALRHNVEESSSKPTVPIDGSVAPVLRASKQAGGQSFDPLSRLDEGFWSGDYGAGNDGSRTVDDDAAWSKLWRSLSAAPAPAIDFKRSQVVAVFLGARPTGGYSVEFAEIQSLPDALIVRWRERSPEAGQSAPPGATSPYALKLTPRTGDPVRFEKVR